MNKTLIGGFPHTICEEYEQFQLNLAEVAARRSEKTRRDVVKFLQKFNTASDEDVLAIAWRCVNTFQPDEALTFIDFFIAILPKGRSGRRGLRVQLLKMVQVHRLSDAEQERVQRQLEILSISAAPAATVIEIIPRSATQATQPLRRPSLVLAALSA